jgi:hypothetical protein
MKDVKSMRQRAPIWNDERGNMFQGVTMDSSCVNLELYNEFPKMISGMRTGLVSIEINRERARPLIHPPILAPLR